MLEGFRGNMVNRLPALIATFLPQFYRCKPRCLKQWCMTERKTHNPNIRRGFDEYSVPCDGYPAAEGKWLIVASRTDGREEN